MWLIGAIVWAVPVVILHGLAQIVLGHLRLMDVELFAFVLLPIGVTLLGALLTGVGLKLIDRADRPAGE